MDFIIYIYKKFGFEFTLELSTRPKKYIGDIVMWDEAEKILVNILNNFTDQWKLNPGDGAFYGPKIDFHIKDALGRSHQCATIQLDFNLAKNFDITYTNEKGEKEVPVVIHRAILGSLERFIGIITEHYGGKWPLWLSPFQAKVIPVAPKYLPYAKKIGKILHDKKYHVKVDNSNNTLSKMIRNAEVEKYNYILVVGEKEETNSTVNVRYRDKKEKKEVLLDNLIKEFEDNIKNFL